MKTGSANPHECRAFSARLSSGFDFNTTIKGGTRAKDRPIFSRWFEHQLPSLSEFSFGGVIGCEAWRKPVLPTRVPAVLSWPDFLLGLTFNTTTKGGTRAKDRPTCFSSWFEHQLPSLSEFSFGGVIGCEAWRKPVLPTRVPAVLSWPGFLLGLTSTPLQKGALAQQTDPHVSQVGLNTSCQV